MLQKTCTKDYASCQILTPSVPLSPLATQPKQFSCTFKKDPSYNKLFSYFYEIFIHQSQNCFRLYAHLYCSSCQTPHYCTKTLFFFQTLNIQKWVLHNLPTIVINLNYSIYGVARGRQSSLCLYQQWPLVGAFKVRFENFEVCGQIKRVFFSLPRQSSMRI